MCRATVIVVAGIKDETARRQVDPEVWLQGGTPLEPIARLWHEGWIPRSPRINTGSAHEPVIVKPDTSSRQAMWGQNIIGM